MGVQIRVETASMYVGGRWTASASGDVFEARSPSTGEIIATLPRGTRDDARAAIKTAGEAAAGWARRSAFERAAAMERIATTIEGRREDLARTLTLDQGKPLIAEAYAEVDELVAYFRMAAADATRIDGAMPPSVDAAKRVLVYRVPVGVVGVISPWNWPYMMPGELIAPALAAGNAVVWNPASSTSLCAVRLAECIVAAGLPPGVFNLVTGPGATVGDEIAANPGTHGVGFIGSVEAGERVAARAAGKELLLEMGGNGPLVVLDDADLDAAVAASLTACYLNAGQSCTAGESILVHERVHDAYVAKLGAAVREMVRLGDPFEPTTTMGPLNNEKNAAKIERHIEDAVGRGATVVEGGRRQPRFGSPLFFEPTIVDGVTRDIAVAREETFGPIAPVQAIRSVEEALDIVNGSPYGLLTSVFTSDLRRGLRFAEQARAGWVNVNEGTNYWEPHLPFGGASGSSSGLGRVGGRFTIDRFTQLKTVVVNLA